MIPCGRRRSHTLNTPASASHSILGGSPALGGGLVSGKHKGKSKVEIETLSFMLSGLALLLLVLRMPQRERRSRCSTTWTYSCMSLDSSCTTREFKPFLLIELNKILRVHTIFSSQDDRPNSIRIPVSWLRFGLTSEITLKFSRFTALSSENRPCTSDPNYNFNRCIERTYAYRY